MAEPLALDTTPEAEARQVALLRNRTPEERLRMACELSASAMAMSRAAIANAQPRLSKLEQARLLYGLQFGEQRAAQVRQPPSIAEAMSIAAAVLPLVAVFEHLHVPYYIGGGVAGIAYSLPRTTYGVDIMAALAARHIPPFVAALETDFYLDRCAIVDAITRRTSFNMTHQATNINIDIFISQGKPFDHAQFARVRRHLLPGAQELVNLASPEDVLLDKLAWYELGNRVSDQQWRDVQSILRVQADALDRHYLQVWASQLGLSELLDAALCGERPLPVPGKEREQGSLF